MENNFTPLTPGVVTKIHRGETIPVPFYIQVLGVKRIGSTAGNPDNRNRYRLVLSDGVLTHNFAMLSTPLNYLYESNKLDEFSIIRVDRYVPSTVNRADCNERQVIILFEVTPLHLGSEVGHKISTGPPPTVPEARKENVNGNAEKPANQYKPPSQPQQQRLNESMNMSSADLSEHLTMPIESLSPYQNKWVIKARVTAKSNVRTWSNAKGEGKLFSMDLCDETGEIRCTGFRDQVDRFYDMIEIDKVYYISKCQLKPANKQYSKLKNDYEMTMTNETQIQPCNEDASSIPKLRYDLVPISDIANLENNTIIDMIGVCKEATDITKLTSRTTGKELTKRDVTLVDSSNSSISLTLWGEDAANFNDFDHPVVLLKSVRVGEYNGGKTLGTISNTVIKINPDIPEGHRMKGWYEQAGATNQFTELSAKGGQGNMSTEWVTLHEAFKIRNMGAGDKPDYFQISGMIHTIRSNNMMYKACPNADCNKKLVETDGNGYRCEKCNLDTHEFKYRLLVNMLVGDWTSNRWVTMFSDVGEQVFEKKAEEIAQIIEQGKDATEAFFQTTLFNPKVFKLRSKIETYGDVPRNKISILSVSNVNYKEYNATLLKNIRRLTGIEMR